MLSENISLKEWNAVVEALGSGRQTILIRKYKTSKKGFFLYPTYSYTKNEDYLDYFQVNEREFVKKNAFPKREDKKVEIKYYAKVERVIESLNSVSKFKKYHIWNKNHIDSYLKHDKANIWFLRVYKLKNPEMAETDSHALVYAKLNKKFSLKEANPILTDEEFEKIDLELGK